MFKKVMLFVATLALAACSKVPAGNVGVKVFLLGGDKGVDSQVLTPGRYWIGMNEDLYLFPTFTQNYVWSKEGDQNEEISFQTSEGMTVYADVGISYSIVPDKVPLVFQKYRKGPEEITDLYLRNMVRDSLNTKASYLKVEDVYGSGKGGLMTSVIAEVREQVSPLGINVEKIYWIGEIRLPGEVKNALNAKITATQKTQQRENEVAQSKAEADKAIEAARGDAESTLLRARAEAEAIKIRGEALRQNSSLVDLTLAEKWDGKLPVNMYGGGAVPFIDINKK